MADGLHRNGASGFSSHRLERERLDRQDRQARMDTLDRQDYRGREDQRQERNANNEWRGHRANLGNLLDHHWVTLLPTMALCIHPKCRPCPHMKVGASCPNRLLPTSPACTHPLLACSNQGSTNGFSKFRLGPQGERKKKKILEKNPPGEGYKPYALKKGTRKRSLE